ncbi:MAG: hypothetical protein PSV16_12645 [Flavobacterium sp.]|nr:hypothetical protein [Flavobacterium sp.]
MMQILISVDPSTKFLYGIIEYLNSKTINFDVIEIQPSDDSYESAKETILNLKKGSSIIFLGHGREDRIYGGENLPSYEKKSLASREEMKIFEAQNIFILACNSADLLKSTFMLCKFQKSIGFGGLPTSEEEVEDDKKLSLIGISPETISKFKSAIVETVSGALEKYCVSGDNSFYYLKDNLILLIDKKINYAIFEENDRNLADLLFNMRNEISLY